MSGFYVDLDELKHIQESVGATARQFSVAYSRALTRVLSRMHKETVAAFIFTTGAKNRKKVKEQRVKRYRSKNNGATPDSGKIWIGLNDMRVGELKGMMKNPPKRKRKRDKLGRYVQDRGARGASFTPRNSSLVATSFPGSFVTVFNGRKSIFTRIPGKPYLREAQMAINDEMNKKISSTIAKDAGELLMVEFKKELEGIIRRGFSG